MLQVVELKVHLHCKDCEKAVREALCKITGVKCVEMDMGLNKIRVLRYMDHRVVEKTIQKSGRKAEVLSSSSSSIRSSWQLQEGQSPRLPGGYRCIIPRCCYTSSKRSASVLIRYQSKLYYVHFVKLKLNK
ncbi:hypothetical protein Pint_13884 [Pistacia integerrima]|uniref:Uncharacterized protein n=1 Tax=Pistacia integerrima TaxID=434235 RepID=A0ACC0Y796_9ROSI|nr:hypothetical protein Pint_13884 [Pistacia integerrima]